MRGGGRFYSAQAIRSADGEKAAQIMKRRFPDTAVGKRPKQRHINAIPLFLQRKSFSKSGKHPVAVLGERADFEFRKTPISHRTRILARSRSVSLTASSAGEALHVPAAGLAAAGSPYLRECTLSFVRLRFPRRACRLTSFFCLGGGARNLVCLPRRTRSPVRFRFGCSISMLGVLPHIFSRFPAPPRSLRCAGDNVRATSFASASDAQSRPLSRAGTVSAYLRSRAEDRLRQMCAASPAFPHRV